VVGPRRMLRLVCMLQQSTRSLLKHYFLPFFLLPRIHWDHGSGQPVRYIVVSFGVSLQVNPIHPSAIGDFFSSAPAGDHSGTTTPRCIDRRKTDPVVKAAVAIQFIDPVRSLPCALFRRHSPSPAAAMAHQSAHHCTSRSRIAAGRSCAIPRR
jgi:hypothetical protein